MSNLFDYNSRANDALVGGETSESAFGFGHPKPGLNLARPNPATDPALLRSRERVQAAQASLNAPRPRGEPVVGYNPQTGDVFSGGKTFKSDYDGYKQAAASGLFNVDNPQLPAGFEPVYASELARKVQRDVQRSTGFFEGANDVAIEVANAAAGGISAMGNMVSPGNRFSQAIDEGFIAEGNRKQSDPVKYQKDLLAKGLESSELGTQAAAVGSYLYNNPLQAAAQAAGSLAGPGLFAKGARALGGARAGTATMMGTSGAMAGGDAAQSAYQQVMNAPGLAHLPPEQRERMATEAARKASVVPFVIGAAAGAVGAEGALGRGLTSQTGKGVLRTGLIEGGSEFVEEGATALSGNVAASQYDPSIDVGKGVFGQALMGGALGLGMGAAVGAVQPRAPKVDPQTGQGDLLAPEQEGATPTPTPTPSYIPVGQQAQRMMTGKTAPGLYGYSDLESQQTFPGMLSEGRTQTAIDALNGAPTQADNLAQQKTTTQRLNAQRTASEVGQQWQDLQAQQEQDRLNKVWPAAVAGQEWQDVLNQKPVRKGDFEDAMDPDFMSGVDPFAARPATTSEWAPSGQQFTAPLDTRMIPGRTIEALSPSGESAPAVAAPVSPAPATEQGLSPGDEPLQAKAAAVSAGKIPARKPGRKLDKPEKLALVRAINGKINDAVKIVLGENTVAAIERIHALATRRMAILDQMAAGKKLVKNRKGGWGFTKKGGTPVDLRDMRQGEAEANLATAYDDLMKELSANAEELVGLFQSLEGDVGRQEINVAQRVSKRKAAGGVQDDAPMNLSRAYRDYVQGDMTATQPVPGPAVGATRERTELGGFTFTKWASVADEFKYGGKRYTGVKAVLMKIRHHSGNPLLASIASRLYRMDTEDGFKPPELVFYTKMGRQVVDAKGKVEIDESQKFSDLPGVTSKTRAMYVASTNTIYFGPDGMGADTVLHELIHAYLIGYVRSNPKSPEVAALNDLRKHVITHLKKNSDPKAQKLAQLLESDTQGLDEFLAYGLTEHALQQFMLDMPGLKGHGYFKDAWNAFAALIRKVLGLPADNQKAFSQFLLASGELLEKSYAMPVSDGRTMESRSTKAKVGYAKVAEFWKRVTSTPAGNLFQTAKMDSSYGKPDRSFTMEEILAHHLPGKWKITPAEKGAPNPDGTRVERGWELVNQNENEGGKFGIYENERGEVTVQSPEASEGKSRGSKVLQAALAYAFYNGKVFVNELEGFGMTDVAVTRYAEAMASAAIKYGSTDFMRPHARQIDPATRGPEDASQQGGQKFVGDAEFYKWGLKGWKDADAKGSMESRFETNLNLLAKMLTSMAFAGRPELESYSFYADEGFRDENGSPAKDLTATQKRAVIVNSVASMSEGRAMDQAAGMALMDDEQRTEAGVEGALYATTLPPSSSGIPMNQHGVTPPGLDMRGYAGTTAWLEPIVRAMLPTVYGSDPKLARAAGKWVADSIASLQKNSPALAGWLSKWNANFNVSESIAKLVEQFKTDRQAPTTSAHEFGRWVQSAKSDEVIDAFRFMDEYDADPKAAKPGELPPHVLQKTKDALAALRTAIAGLPKDSDAAKVFADLKPSEMLTHALQADAVSGSSFGAREEKLLSGRKEMVREQDVVAPSPGGVMKTGKFYPVYGKDGKIKTMVQEGSVGKRTDVDKNRLFRFDKVNSAGDWVFRELTTAKGLFNDATLKGEAADTVATSFLNTVSIMANAVATRKLTSDIARIGSATGQVFDDEAALAKHLGKDSVRVFNLSDDEARNITIQNENRKPGNWVRVPGSSAYGELAGKVIAGPVWARISDALNRKSVVDFAAYNGLMRVFKASKTRYSPSTIATNVMGNFTLAYLNNVPFSAVRDGLKMYIKYKLTPGRLKPHELQLMSAFHASGATLGDWSTNEIKQVMYEAMAAESEVSGVGFLNTLADITKYHGSVVERAAKLAKRKGLRVDDVMGDVYATTDNMFRLAAFMTKYGELQKTSSGKSDAEIMQEAGQYAKKAFLDYDNDARFVNVMRQTMLPFVSFTYAYSGRLLDVAKNEPWKLATLALVYSMVSAAASAAGGTGDEEEDEKQRIRDKMTDTTWFGANKQWRVGTTAEGRAVYFDAAKWFMPSPLEFKDNPNGFLGFHSFPSAITPNNPWTSMLMYGFGFDPYIGQKFTKDTMSNMENVTEVAKKTSGIFSPPWLPKLSGPKPGVLGEEESLFTYYARTLLLPIKSNSAAESKKILQIEIGKTEDAFDKELSSMRRAEKLGKITAEELADSIEKLRKRKAEKLAELRKGL